MIKAKQIGSFLTRYKYCILGSAASVLALILSSDQSYNNGCKDTATRFVKGIFDYSEKNPDMSLSELTELESWGEIVDDKQSN